MKKKPPRELVDFLCKVASEGPAYALSDYYPSEKEMLKIHYYDADLAVYMRTAKEALEGLAKKVDPLIEKLHLEM